MSIGSEMSRRDRKKVTEQAAEQNYGGGHLFAPIQFKAEEEGGDPDFMVPLNFQGFANTGHPDLGRDIVAPEAFTRATIAEFLKYGRQLLHMHDPRAQVGEITAAEVVSTGKRSILGNRAGGLKVDGFVDSPFDKDFMIPDHPMAKVIHFARMQVQKGRLKALSIGWMPTKTEMKRMKDPRTGVEASFRIVKALILREVSLVTFAMNPQSMIELRKAYAGAYGDDIAAALFCDDPNGCDIIPERVDGFQIDRIRDMVVDSAVKAANSLKGEDPDSQSNDQTGGQSQMKLVSLDGKPKQKIKLVSLYGG